MKQTEKNRQTLCRKTITVVLSSLLVCFALNTFAASIDFRNLDALEGLAKTEHTHPLETVKS